MNDTLGPRRVILLTGEGKGKTTAALGTVLRAVGHGQSVLVVQFVKGDSTTGEVAALSRLSEVHLVQSGLGFVPPAAHPEYKDHRAKAGEGFRLAEEALVTGRFDMVVLDEICAAVDRGLVEEDSLLKAIEYAHPRVCLVMTGRGATDTLMAIADTVSNIQPVRHALQLGRTAERGVEW